MYPNIIIFHMCPNYVELYNTCIYKWSLAPNGPEKWGCRMRIRDLFSKIRDLFSKIRDYETKKTAGAAEPPEPPSLAPM